MPRERLADALRPAVFLDRDGVLNRRHWRLVRKPSEIVILPGAAEAAAALSQGGFALAIATNQEWVSRGYITLADHEEVMRLVVRAIEEAGGKVEAVYAALDSRTAKPKPDMLVNGAREHGFDLARSFMVGDNLKDMLAAERAGCRGVLVDPRFRTRLQRAHRHAAYVCRDLPAAAEWILAQRR